MCLTNYYYSKVAPPTMLPEAAFELCMFVELCSEVPFY
jgi:hypothetical protein